VDLRGKVMTLRWIFVYCYQHICVLTLECILNWKKEKEKRKKVELLQNSEVTLHQDL